MYFLTLVIKIHVFCFLIDSFTLLALRILLHEPDVSFHLPTFRLTAAARPILLDAPPMEETNSPPLDPEGPLAASALAALPSGVAALAGPGLAACALAAPASGPAAWPSGVAASPSGHARPWRGANGAAAPGPPDQGAPGMYDVYTY